MDYYSGSQAPAWEPIFAKLCFASREVGASGRDVPKRELGNEERTRKRRDANIVSVKVSLHRTHRQFTGGLETVETQGETVGACLQHLAREYPGIGEALFEKSGKLRYHIEVFLNLETTYPEELATPVKDGDELHVAVMLAGG